MFRYLLEEGISLREKMLDYRKMDLLNVEFLEGVDNFYL